MEFTIKSGSPEKQRSACVVVGVFDNRKLSLSAELIDRASNGYISEIIRRGDMEGKLGATLAPAQRARHAGRPRASGRPGQGARLPRPRIPLGDPLRGQAAQRNRLVRGRGLPDRGKGQAARSRVARRARRRGRHGVRLPLRADEEPAHGSPAAAAQADAVGAAALGPHRRRSRVGAGPGHRARHGHGARPGQHAGQHVHADVPCRARDAARRRVSRHQGHHPRAQGMRGARHGLVPVGDQRQRSAAPFHRLRVHAVEEGQRQAECAGRQGHHVRLRRHLDQVRGRPWTR